MSINYNFFYYFKLSKSFFWIWNLYSHFWNASGSNCTLGRLKLNFKLNFMKEVDCHVVIENILWRKFFQTLDWILLVYAYFYWNIACILEWSLKYSISLRILKWFWNMILILKFYSFVGTFNFFFLGRLPIFCLFKQFS